MNNPIQTYVDQLRPHGRHIGRLCAIFAAGCFERLDRIAENTSDNSRTRPFVDPMNFGAAETKVRDVPVGESWRLCLLAVGAATTITIRSGGVLRYVKTFAGPDTVGPDAMIAVGSGAPLEINSTGAAEVTMHLAILERNEPRPGIGGERSPAGIHTNAMDLAIQQHFPGLMDSPYGDDEPKRQTTNHREVIA